MVGGVPAMTGVGWDGMGFTVPSQPEHSMAVCGRELMAVLPHSQPQRQAVPHTLRAARRLRRVHQRQLRVHVVQQHEAVRGLQRLRGLVPLRAVHGVVHHEQLST